MCIEIADGEHVIWKQSCAGWVPGVSREVVLPADAQVVAFGPDGMALAFWFACAVPTPVQDVKGVAGRVRRFEVAFTGQSFGGARTYHGTAVWQGYLWHLLEVL